MKKIFTGFIFIFLDFSLNLGTSTVGLIPDFIGYIILIGGLSELADESSRFITIKPCATVMAVYTAVLYAADLFGLSVNLSILSVLLGLLSVLASLYISYNIVQGVREIESTRMCDLNGAALNSTWTVMAVLSVLSFVTIFLPPLALLCIIALFICGIIFLVAFSRTKNLYEALLQRNISHC